MKLPTKTIEKNLFKSGYRLIYAIDEVGMGCLAGPVVVCAVAFKKEFYNRKHKKLYWLRDSKLLQAKKREDFAEELLKIKNLEFRIVYCYPRTIDKLNIYNAVRLAMKKAILKMNNELRIKNNGSDQNHNSKFIIHNSKIVVLVDGPHKITGLKIEQLPIVRGDRKVFAIACASIIAKVFRDRMMVKYAKKYPGYGFEKHKGYGTKQHQVQLASLGPCDIHRRSFRLTY